MGVRMEITVFWNVTPCNFLIITNFSEDPAFSDFMMHFSRSSA